MSVEQEIRFEVLRTMVSLFDCRTKDQSDALLVAVDKLAKWAIGDEPKS